MTTRLTTRLRQNRVSSTDPAYPSLQEQLAARSGGGTGTGYILPLGGIPRTDMTVDVQEAIAKAEASYEKPAAGIPLDDLTQAIQDSLSLADTAYQKPAGGIVLGDLETSIQQRLIDYSAFYLKPVTGIPEVDLDADAKEALSLARSAYQKPSMGVARADLAKETTDSLDLADTAYQKPASGIPLADLAEPVVSDTALNPFRDHMKDASIHITDHTNLKNVGTYTHEEIDDEINRQRSNLETVVEEIRDARDIFHSLGARIETALGKNTEFRVDEQYEWQRGKTNGLRVNIDGNVSFDFTPEQIRADLYDMKDVYVFDPAKKVSGITFNQSLAITRGADEWVQNTGLRNDIGMRMEFFVYAPVTGEYDFTVVWSGYIRMQVAGKLLFEDTTAYQYYSALPRTGKVTLEGGRMYPVVVEGKYFHSGERTIGLYWKRPDRMTSEVIPMDYVNIGGYGIGTVGTYESEILDFGDTQISRWYMTADMLDWWAEDDVAIEICTSDDGTTFGDWTAVGNNMEIANITPARFVRVRFTMTKQYNQYTPLLRSYAIRYISSAYNEYYNEIIQARDTYLSLKDRFTHIERALIELGDLQMEFNTSNINPEYFVSVRFAAVELNLLQQYYNQTSALTEFSLLNDGFVDHFATTNNIDLDASDYFLHKPGEIMQGSNFTTWDTNEDWYEFTRDRIEVINDSMRLSLATRANGVQTDGIDNSYSWNYSEESRLYDYHRWIAQPFYVRDYTGWIKRVRVRTATSGGQNTYRAMICELLADGSPNVSAPLWTGTSSTGGNTWIDFNNIYVKLQPGQKYYLVMSYSGGSGSATVYMWQALNDSQASIRLRSENPEGKELFMMHRATGTPTKMDDWTMTNRFLTFTMEEWTEYEEEGFAEFVQDYHEVTRFLTAEYDLTNPNSGVIEIKYSSSNDQVQWSTPTSDIASVPDGRFLKTLVHLVRDSVGYEPPTINSIRIGRQGIITDIISKPFELAHIPTHSLLIVDQPKDQHIRFWASRDDGGTWTEVFPNQMTPLLDCRPGTRLRLRATFDIGYPTEKLNGWAIQGIYHRDVHAQNITALHEEYIAENNQKVFKLSDPYPVGTNALQVYVNGIYQSILRDYQEIDERTVSFVEPLIGADATGQGADVVTFRVAAGAYDQHDRLLVKRLDDLDDFHQPYMRSHEVEYVYDGGKLKQEIYSGIDYYVIEYTYNADGTQNTITTTTAKTITVETFSYNTDGTLKKKSVTVSEVAP